MIDEWLGKPDGTQFRFRQRQIPTKEQALSLVAKKKAEAFEGRFFDRRKESTFRVRDAWELYEPIAAATTTAGRASRHVHGASCSTSGIGWSRS
jgi:hypothetical protein